MSIISNSLLRIWYKKHPIPFFLKPLETIYSCIAKYKRNRFIKNKSRIYRAPVPVIVVGNITIGGTGKTPLIIWMINYCRLKGLRVGVVSRGYGARPPFSPWLVTKNQGSYESGDEPLLIVKRTGVLLVIDPKRKRAIKKILLMQAVDIILSDDGLQHYHFARDLELVLIDNVRKLGNGRCLPIGPLREPIERLKDVDARLYNGLANDTGPLDFSLILKPIALVNIRSGKKETLDYFPFGQSLHAVAGIGNPSRFFKTLRTLNWIPIPHPFKDHMNTYSKKNLSFSPLLPLIMTEKDAVKCKEFADFNWWYLAIDAIPSPSFTLWFDHQLENLKVKSHQFSLKEY